MPQRGIESVPESDRHSSGIMHELDRTVAVELPRFEASASSHQRATNAYEDSRRTHVGKGARSDGRDLERRRRQRRGTVQRHPDREREAWVHRLAADQSGSARRRDLRAGLASTKGHRGLRVAHEHQGRRNAERARQHLSGEQVFRQHLPDGVLRRRRRAADANARSAAGNRRTDSPGRRPQPD